MKPRTESQSAVVGRNRLVAPDDLACERIAGLSAQRLTGVCQEPERLALIRARASLRFSFIHVRRMSLDPVPFSPRNLMGLSSRDGSVLLEPVVGTLNPNECPSQAAVASRCATPGHRGGSVSRGLRFHSGCSIKRPRDSQAHDSRDTSPHASRVPVSWTVCPPTAG